MIKKTPLALLLSGLFIHSSHAELYFPPEMISVDGESIADLSQYRADGTQLPGVYDVDIYLNKTFYSRLRVLFKLSEANTQGAQDDTGLVPCLNRTTLSDMGIKTELFPAMMALDSERCVNPAEYVTGSFSVFDFQHMRLDISAPQMVTRNRIRGETDPARWDNGINAVVMNYNFSGSDRREYNGRSSSRFLGLTGGVNLGAWRLRDERNWNSYNNRYGSRQQWQRIRTYVERPVIPLRSKLEMGESTTASNVFESLGFRGVQLSSDDDMLPDTLRGFAPVVRGVADSNAEISIRQNGYVIYRTSVSPGAFEITDLNPTYSSGDLEVSVTEASGKVRVFTVPYSSLPVLQREGQMKYSLTVGRFRGNGDRYEKPSFTQGTLMWGLPHDVTLYGGGQFSPDYLAIQTGAGINMGRLGAISADITQANSTLANGSKNKGQSLRFLYAHAFNPTGTTFRLTGYRYSTRGFHTLSETALKRMSGRLNDHTGLGEYGEKVTDTRSDFYNLYNNKRARFEASISQSLGDYGALWLSGVRQTYWNTKTGSDSLNVGYSNTLGPVSYSVNYGYSRYRNDNAPSYKDSNISLSLSVPLDRLFSVQSANPVYATAYGSRDSRGGFSQQGGLSGQLLADRNLSWNVSQGYSRSGNAKGSESGNASLYYRGVYGNTNLGYSRSGDSRQVNYGLAGSMLLHRNGLTLGQPLSDTSVLVATPGISNVGIKNEPGVATDWRGYAIKPYASAYRENRIQIDTDALDEYTDVDSAVAQIIPTKGAIVRTEFKARRGYRVLMTLMRNGKPLPFGTMVSAGDNTSIMSDGGQVYLSGMTESGEVTARWGDDAGQQCHASYRLTKAGMESAVARISAVCR